MAIRSIQGTHDILPGTVELWQRIEDTIRSVFGRYGFAEIRTPVLEWTELFARGVGSATELVQKEMYSLPDSKGRSITLRPEGTAPVIRAYIEHHLDRAASVSRLYYIGPMFRHERPQKGRYRQFHQLGIEVIGSESPAVEAEVIEAVIRFLNELGLDRFDVVVNSVGDANCRPAYVAKLAGAMEPLLGEFCGQCQIRHKTNPLRIFDCKVPSCRELLPKLPRLIDHLCDDCRQHHQEFLKWLETLEIDYKEDPNLVRGLDYYVRTTFELISDGLGPTQNAILGGGRYDGLSELLGGPRAPAFGFALGLERLVLLLNEGKETLDFALPAPDLFLAYLDEDSLKECVLMATRLRGLGFHVYVDYEGRSLRAQLRLANRLNCLFSCVIGEEELASGRLKLKRMSDGLQIETQPTAMDTILSQQKAEL